MSVKECCKWHHHANGSSVAFLLILNHILEPSWKLFVRNLILSHVLLAKKAQNKGVGFFISFLYTDCLNFFPAKAVIMAVYLSNTDQFRSGCDNPWMFFWYLPMHWFGLFSWGFPPFFY